MGCWCAWIRQPASGGGRVGDTATARRFSSVNRLIVTTEDGDIVLVEASPDAHRELGRFTAFSQKLWNPPALAGRFLIVRTDTEAACYELAGT